MVIAIASQKGGVGKTSSSISMSAAIARKGKRVLLVDIDSQANSSNKRVLLVDIDSQANSSKVLLPNYQQLQKHQTIYATILERGPLPVLVIPKN